MSRNLPKNLKKILGTGEDRLESDQSCHMLTMVENIKKYRRNLSENYSKISYIKEYQHHLIFENIGHWMGQIRIRSELPDADHGASNDWSSDEAMHFH